MLEKVRVKEQRDVAPRWLSRKEHLALLRAVRQGENPRDLAIIQMMLGAGLRNLRGRRTQSVGHRTEGEVGLGSCSLGVRVPARPLFRCPGPVTLALLILVARRAGDHTVRETIDFPIKHGTIRLIIIFLF